MVAASLNRSAASYRYDSDESLFPERPRRRRARRVLLIALGLVAFVAIADFLYVAVGLATSLRDAEQALSGAKRALQQGDVVEARLYADQARSATDESTDLVGHPTIRALAAIPWLGDDAENARSLASAAGWASTAAARIVDAAELAGVNPEHFLGGIYRGGRLDLPTVEQATPLVTAADDALAQARKALAATGGGFLPPINNAIGDARSTVTEASGTVHKGSVLLGVLPGLLGAEGDRRYLLAFQALNEARGTGGVIGFYGLLRASDGRLVLERVSPVRDLADSVTRPVDAPRWFEKNYGPQKATLQSSQSNITPNFPAAASVLLEMYEQGMGKKLDGVFAMDAVALTELLPATGPIRAPTTGQTITAKNAERIIMRDSYLEFREGPRQEHLLTDVIEGFWGKLQSGDFGSVKLATGLSNAVRAGHIKVYSTDLEEETSLASLGAAGDYFSSGPNVQLVFHENIAPNKVDYYFRRQVSTLVRLQTNGVAQVSTEITLRNEAPDGPKSVLLGDGKKFPVGTNVMLLYVLRPQRSILDEFTVDGKDRTPARIFDTGYPVTWYALEIPPGTEQTVTLSYRTPMHVIDGDTAELDMTFYPHTTVVPDDLSVSVQAPDGFSIDGAPGLTIEGATASGGGPLVEPRTVTVRISAEQ
jgi:Protein of unknown function (DUF4012)